MCTNEKNHLHFVCKWLILSDPGGIQTPNLLIRSQMLYSVELRGLSGCKGKKFRESGKEIFIACKPAAELRFHLVSNFCPRSRHITCDTSLADLTATGNPPPGMFQWLA